MIKIRVKSMLKNILKHLFIFMSLMNFKPPSNFQVSFATLLLLEFLLTHQITVILCSVYTIVYTTS